MDQEQKRGLILPDLSLPKLNLSLIYNHIWPEKQNRADLFFKKKKNALPTLRDQYVKSTSIYNIKGMSSVELLQMPYFVVVATL